MLQLSRAAETTSNLRAKRDKESSPGDFGLDKRLRNLYRYGNITGHTCNAI